MGTGTANLIHHIKNVLKYGAKAVVAINRFATDTEAELNVVRDLAIEAGAFDAVVAIDLAAAVEKACKSARDSSTFKFLYPLELTLKQKIEKVCIDMYGADGVEYSAIAEQRLKSYEDAGYGSLPVCMAKTQYSLSCDASAKGVPTGFKVLVRDVRAAVGAGYVYPICGDIMTVPGLPTRPGFYDVDMDLNTGKVVGLF